MNDLEALQKQIDLLSALVESQGKMIDQLSERLDTVQETSISTSDSLTHLYDTVTDILERENNRY